MKTLLLALAMILLASSGLQAQPGPEAGAWKKMNLSEEQKSTLKDIRANTQKQMIDLRASLQKKRVDLRAMMDADNPDRSAFERLNREIADLQVQQKLLLFDADRDVSNALDPAQLEQWKEIKERRLKQFGENMRARSDKSRSRDRDGRGHRGGPYDVGTPPPPPAD